MFNTLNYAILKTQLQQIASPGGTWTNADDIPLESGGTVGTVLADISTYFETGTDDLGLVADTPITTVDMGVVA